MKMMKAVDFGTMINFEFAEIFGGETINAPTFEVSFLPIVTAYPTE